MRIRLGGVWSVGMLLGEGGGMVLFMCVFVLYGFCFYGYVRVCH